MKLEKEGNKAWSQEAECMRCDSILRVNYRTIAYESHHDGIQTYAIFCPFCNEESFIDCSVPSAIVQRIKDRSPNKIEAGFLATPNQNPLGTETPFVVKQGRKPEHSHTCTECEAKLTINYKDLRESSLACLSCGAKIKEEMPKFLVEKANTPAI